MLATIGIGALLSAAGFAVFGETLRGIRALLKAPLWVVDSGVLSTLYGLISEVRLRLGGWRDSVPRLISH